MPKLTQIPFGATPQQKADSKDRIITKIQTIGVGQRPSPPRSLIAQSGARKVLVTWLAPSPDIPGGGFRVYKDTENILYTEIRDPQCRQIEVTATSGASPAYINIFVSRVDASGRESRKAWIQGVPTAEAGAPSDPSPPPNWKDQPDGCVEVGTPCVDPEGTTIERIPNRDWIALHMGDREPVFMHPDTLVSVWKKASELQITDRIDSSPDGRWSMPFAIWHEHRASVKEKRTCPGDRSYRARGIRLHNEKNRKQ